MISACMVMGFAFSVRARWNHVDYRVACWGNPTIEGSAEGFTLPGPSVCRTRALHESRCSRYN